MNLDDPENLFYRPKGVTVTAYISKLKHNTPCTDCGIAYPFYIMDFDHVGVKRSDPSKIYTQGWTWQEIYAELAQCELVCSNCHRERTYKRQLGKRLQKDSAIRTYDWDTGRYVVNSS